MTPKWYQLSGVPIPPILLTKKEAEGSNLKLAELGDSARWVLVSKESK